MKHTLRVPLVIALFATIVICTIAGREEVSSGAAFGPVPELQTGFRFLYEQNFPDSRQACLKWEGNHPEDPFGPAAVAASYLFEEFYRQGVLTSDFFLDDRKFLRGIAGKPDPARLRDFYSALDRTRVSAQTRMKTNPNDPEALFALTLASGMQADALSLLEHKPSESLRPIKEAENDAEKLLGQKPDAADAWLALGTAHYILVFLPGPKRFALRLGGIHGDRKQGMEELTRTASEGRYLRPYAKVLLALAERREGKAEPARDLLRELNEEFPASPLFAVEYARLTDFVTPPRVGQ